MLTITWDEPKRRRNLRIHGLDFVALDMTFFEAALIRPAKLGRLMAIGRLPDGVVAVVFVTLGREDLSVISMRSASRKERRDYGKATP